MRESNKTDVIVIGAGPAGSATALEVAKAGHDVMLIEKDAFPGQNNVCGGGISEAAVEHLDLTSEVIEKEISRSIYHFPWRTFAQNITFVSVLRDVFDRFLADRAVQRGARLLTSTVAYRLSRSDDGIGVRLRNRSTGLEFRAIGKLAVVACGAGSLTSGSFGNIGFTKKPNNAYMAAIYEIEWKDNPLSSFEFIFDPRISPWGYGWVFPKRNHVNVGVGCLMSMMKKNIRFYLDSLVDKHPAVSRTLRDRRKIRFAADIIPCAHARRLVGDRLLAVGDAAGMVDPIWGGGIHFALTAGSLAGQVAVEALEEKEFDEQSLLRFDKQWRKSKDYRGLRKAYLISRVFLAYSKLDKYAYLRLMDRLVKSLGASELPML